LKGSGEREGPEREKVNFFYVRNREGEMHTKGKEQIQGPAKTGEEKPRPCPRAIARKYRKRAGGEESVVKLVRFGAAKRAPEIGVEM